MGIDFLLPEMIAYAASCMSLLRHIEIRQTKPFAIICDGIVQQDTLAEHMKIFTDNRIYSLKTFATHTLQFISMAKDDILFLQYAQDTQANYLPWLCEIVAEGYWEGEPINCLVCVLYNGYLPADQTDFFSVIVPVREVAKLSEGRWSGCSIQQKLADKTTDLHLLWEVLKQKSYREFMLDSLREDEEILYVAAAIWGVLQDRAESLEELCTMVREKISISRDSRDRSDLPDVFVKILYANSDLLCPMMTYCDASKKADADDPPALYDENFYYLPSSVIDSIVKEMAEFAGAEEIKVVLAEAGYLDVQGKARKYYTQKITVGGKRLHYFKLKREYIDQVGEATLLTISN